jgi:hypothetical protein
MFALTLAILIVVGVGVVVTARIVYRRTEAWADAMILSFGLLPPEEEDGDSQDGLPHFGGDLRHWGSDSAPPRRQVILDESEHAEPVELVCS